MESQAGLPHLQAAGAQFTDQVSHALGARNVRGLDPALDIKQVWSIESMEDQLDDGRVFRLFNVSDNFNRAAIGIEIDF